MKFIFLKILLMGVFFVPSDFKLIKTIHKKADFIALDNLGFFYLYENYNLYKYSEKGDLINSFTNLTYGKLSAFDASDPYMLLLYYQDLNQIVFLDNQLAPIGSPINLDDFELYQVNKVCKSKEFAVWIYDDFDKRLIQYAFNPKGILTEINLSLLNISGEINFIRESGKYLYLGTAHYLYIFDIYGSLLKSIKKDIPENFQIVNNHIIYSKKNELFIYSPDVDRADTLNIQVVENPKSMILNDNFLYVMENKQVVIYKKE